MPVERRGRVIAVELGPTGLYPGRSPKFQRKAAAFVRWHEPDDARESSPESVSGSGGNSPGLPGIQRQRNMSAAAAAFIASGHGGPMSGRKDLRVHRRNALRPSDPRASRQIAAG